FHFCRHQRGIGIPGRPRGPGIVCCDLVAGPARSRGLFERLRTFARCGAHGDDCGPGPREHQRGSRTAAHQGDSAAFCELRWVIAVNDPAGDWYSSEHFTTFDLSKTLTILEVDSREPTLHGVNAGDPGGLLSTVETRRVLMVAGGTGGHVFPALAVAEELRSRQRAARRYAVEFLGTRRGLDTRLLSRTGFPFRTISGAGLKGVRGLRRMQNLLVLPRSAIETALVLRELQPDVVFGMGGYIAGPAMLEAALRDIPTLLLEPNALPGFTNRVLAPVVRLAAVGFEDAARYYGVKARVTGHPVRKAF